MEETWISGAMLPLRLMGEHPAAPAMAGVRNQSPVAAFTAVFMPMFGVTWRQTLFPCALLAAQIARKQGFPLGWTVDVLGDNWFSARTKSCAPCLTPVGNGLATEINAAPRGLFTSGDNA